MIPSYSSSSNKAPLFLGSRIGTSLPPATYRRRCLSCGVLCLADSRIGISSPLAAYHRNPPFFCVLCVLDFMILYILWLLCKVFLDFVPVLHGSNAVKTFSSSMHCYLGAGLSVAAEPLGRILEADLRVGDKGSGMCYTYSCSKVSVSGGKCCSTRIGANLRFYGDPYLTTADILLGNVKRPKAAAALYSALDDLSSRLQS